MRAGRIWGSGVGNMNLPFTFEALTQRYRLAGADQAGVYYDEENRRHLLHIRSIYAETAGNLADAGKMEEAGKLLDRIDQGMKESNMPYAMSSRDNQHNQTGLLILEAAYKSIKRPWQNGSEKRCGPTSSSRRHITVTTRHSPAWYRNLIEMPWSRM